VQALAVRPDGTGAYVRTIADGTAVIVDLQSGTVTPAFLGNVIRSRGVLLR